MGNDLSSGRLDNLDSVVSHMDFRRGDLRDLPFTREVTRGKQVVFHLAAAHGGRGYIETHAVDCPGGASA